MSPLRFVSPVLAFALMLAQGVASSGARAADLPRSEPVVVAAAASLTDVLPRIAAARGSGAPPITFRFDASSRLAHQIEAGAPTDVFISADVEWMDRLARLGRLAPASRFNLAGNALVAVVAREARFVPLRAEDLAAPAIERLALAGESVPAGRYARAALQAMNVWNAVKARVVSGDNVRTALAWVARGEASAGIVYATDALVEPRVRVAFTFPPSSHPPIVYPAAVLTGAAHADEARRFLAFCRTPAARALLTEAGFLPAPIDVRPADGALPLHEGSKPPESGKPVPTSPQPSRSPIR